jgi:preprotein translocase subunit SecD
VKVVVGSIVGTLLAVLVTVGEWLGIVHPLPQPRTEVTIQLDKSTVPQLAASSLFVTVRDGLREPRIGFASISPSGDSVDVKLSDGVDREQARSRLRDLARQGGSDGGTSERFTVADADGAVLRLTPTQAVIAAAAARADDQTVEVLSHRLEGLLGKAAVRREGSDTVIVDLPRQANRAHLEALLVEPGKLSIRFIDTSVSIEDAKQGRMSPESELLSGPDGTPYPVQKQVALSGDNLVDAQPGFDQRTNEPIVTFRFNPTGTRQFARITAQGVGMPMAIVVDNVVLAAPVIREPIVGGSGQISGGFTVERANDLAVMLRSGALPVPLTVVAERDIEH